MKKTLIIAAVGFACGLLFDFFLFPRGHEEAIESIKETEKKMIEKFKKNPNNKEILKKNKKKGEKKWITLSKA
ncbi:MAG: hypothetical protein IJ094_12980 [Bacilli bacterium]|nr:hypothetical protein [Bacilli bacterium]